MRSFIKFEWLRVIKLGLANLWNFLQVNIRELYVSQVYVTFMYIFTLLNCYASKFNLPELFSRTHNYTFIRTIQLYNCANILLMPLLK